MRSLTFAFLSMTAVVLAGGCSARNKVVVPEPGPTQDASGEWDLAVRACEEGDPSGCFSAALAYEHGDGPARNVPRAAALYGRGCELGDPNACVLAANLQLEGEPSAETLEAAGRQLTLACFEGESELGCLVLGTRASEAKWEQGDAARDAAIEAWSHACEAYESIDGCFFAGATLRERKAEGDLERAFRYLTIACAFEHLEACRIAADARACGEGVPEDVPRAIRDHLAACRLGDAASCSQATSFYSVLEEAERGKLDVNLGPVPFLLALRSAQRGLADDAKALAEGLPADQAAWIRASLAFDRGDHASAREALVALRQERPESAEAVLLERAMGAAERGEPLYLAVVHAWAELGRPDLRQGGLVEPPLKFWDIECRSHYRAWLPPEDAAPRPALYDLAQDPEGFPDAVREAAAKIPDDAAVADRLGGILALTGKDTRASPREDWEAARRRLLQTFEGGQDAFSVIVRLAGEEAKTPLSSKDRVALERATEWKIPKETLRAAVDAQAKTLDDDGTWGESPRLMATVGLAGVADAVQVAARAEATGPSLSRRERQRLGKALLRIAEQVYAGGWVVEAYFATGLFAAGAELTGDPKDASRRDEVTAATRRLLERDGVPELGSWPSKRLTDDQLRSAGEDEVEFQKRLDAIALPAAQ